MYSFSGNYAASVPISTFMCLWVFYIFPESVHIFGCSKKKDRSWKYINRRNWETKHYNPVLKVRRLKVSFQRIHNLEPDIYIGCLQALHLLCKYQYEPFSTVLCIICTYVCCRVNILPFGNERIDNCHVALFELWRENLTIRQTLLVLWILFDMYAEFNWTDSGIKKLIKIIQLSEVTLFNCILIQIFLKD
jgi:hypothetical protein